MGKWLLLLFALCMALAFFATACHKAHPQANETGRQLQAGESFEDSGRRLAGDYAVRSLADDYVATAPQEELPWTFSFKDDGAFRSTQESHGAMRIEEGSYLISAQGELVLYIETGGGERLSDARVERYKIEAQSDAELRLRRNGSTMLWLRRK